MSQPRQVEIGLTLPFPIQLPDGDYGGIHITTNPAGGTSVRQGLTIGDDDELTAQAHEQHALSLLDRLNSVLRLYRYHTGDAAVVELTLRTAGSFVFFDAETQQPCGPNEGVFQVLPARVSIAAVRDPGALSAQLRQELGDGFEPPVWHLLVLDSEVAIDEGRHREAVLLAWSAIESCFGTHYGRWISRLTELSSDERAGLVGRDISLANQMTAGLAIAIGVPLHQLLGKDWAKRRTTYRTRNSIIHEGGSASAAQAIEALAFARRVVEVVETVAAQHEQEVTEHG